MAGLSWIDQIITNGIDSILQQEREYQESDRLNNTTYTKVLQMDSYKEGAKLRALKKKHKYLVAFVEPSDYMQLQGLGAIMLYNKDRCMAIFPTEKAPCFMLESYEHIDESKRHSRLPLMVVGVEQLQELEA